MSVDLVGDSAAKDKTASAGAAPGGLRIERHFCPAGVNPFEQVNWEKRVATIKGDNGEVIFQQDNVEVPSNWSQLATNVLASKYLYGERNKPERERSVRELVGRVTSTIADWARADGVFASPADADNFRQELTWLCLNQYGAFNSPVWFNVGLFHQRKISGSEGNFHWDAPSGKPLRTRRGYEFPQASACFIQSVADTMEDIMRLAASEAMLFKFGSGTGTDLSTLRSSQEMLAGGGKPSGPLSFMRVFDQIAGVVKSGGKTRRAAKMQSLRVDHPDILEFIQCKAKEEKKARTLIEAGYEGNYNGEAYGSVMYQNANLSIRVTDEFLKAALDGAGWTTYAVTTGKPMGTHNAADLLGAIAESCHFCGDPGVQYHSTINRWHTCPDSGPINASNPCSEYMFVDDSACNLASLNLMKFRRPDGSMDIESFKRAVRVFIIAQETLVDHCSYPTDKICANSHAFRPLGLGYANLGALLMSLGYPYDSECARNIAGAITGILTGEAYTTSAELAGRLGTFQEYPKNRDPMLAVMGMHQEHLQVIAKSLAQVAKPEQSLSDQLKYAELTTALINAARETWDRAIAAGEKFGYRNAQTTLLAPTGTIGFLMDCDTTGIEPDIALVKYKLLAGGGNFKLVNRTVPLALERLGYTPEEIQDILHHLEENDTIEGSPHLREEHLPVFDCAFTPLKGKRAIHYMGHLQMMAAVQPFLSGAISKTVNMPKECTAEDIRNVYVNGWKMGLKAVAIYRDGSKLSQPVSLKKDKDKKKARPEDSAAPANRFGPHRRRMPITGHSIRHKFDVAGHEGYIHVGLFEDGTPGEIFITMAKEGSTVGGMMDAFATAISLCLQYGVPLEGLIKKFSHQRFEPAGMTANPDIPFAKSIVDYVFRWMGMTFSEEFRKANALRRPGKDQPTATEGVTDDHASGKDGAGAATSKDVPAPGAGIYMPQVGAKPAPPRSALASAGSRLSKSIERIDQQFSHFQEDAPACDTCGSITVRNGNCYKCFNCGSSLGCS
jgi:ribonucleoside-diphosphate reductase alpha chain